METEKQIEVRREEIIQNAIMEFLEKGIDNTKISDIAERAEVGTATVYRYFENKTGLVIACAERMWGLHVQDRFSETQAAAYQALSGFQQIRFILEHVGAMLDACPEQLRLLEEFDNFIVREKIPAQRLLRYEAEVGGVRTRLLEAMEKGKQDGSVRTDLDEVLFYFTAMHSLVSLAQKLLLRGDILQSDSEVAPQRQIRNLIEMQLFYAAAGCGGKNRVPESAASGRTEKISGKKDKIQDIL